MTTPRIPPTLRPAIDTATGAGSNAATGEAATLAAPAAPTGSPSGVERRRRLREALGGTRAAQAGPGQSPPMLRQISHWAPPDSPIASAAASPAPPAFAGPAAPPHGAAQVPAAAAQGGGAPDLDTFPPIGSHPRLPDPGQLSIAPDNASQGTPAGNSSHLPAGLQPPTLHRQIAFGSISPRTGRESSENSDWSTEFSLGSSTSASSRSTSSASESDDEHGGPDNHGA